MLRGDIAIVGMAGLFPGAPNVERFWQNIVSKFDAVTDPPPESWDAGVFYDPDSTENDRVYCKKGGFISPLAFFDPADNGVMPRSVEGGEPDQWLALQVARAALADAGLEGDFPERHRTAVVIGKGTYLNRGNLTAAQHGIVADQTLDILKSLHPEYTESDLRTLRQELKRRLPPFNSDTASGLIPNIIAGRIANKLDLMGPSYTVDAACASSLIALDIAMRDLLTGKADLAVVGGSHVVTPVPVLMLFCQLGALSRHEKIRPFDKDADGTILGEGIGMVVVKRLADAERDGNRIYAVVKGVGTASDGRGLSVMAPRLEGEVEAMRRAYEMAGILPATVGLVEAHGTATTVGDATEVRALAEVWGERAGELPRTALGSVKSMISHLMPAAGIAALIKTALALHHKVLPPTINVDSPNPELGLENSPFYLNTETRPWIHGGSEPRRAAVSSFGFGGINAHVALEEYMAASGASFQSKHLEWDSEAMLFTGPDRAGLMAEVAKVRDYVAANPAVNLKDLAYTLNTRRLEGEHKLAVVAASRTDLIEKLDRATARLSDAGLKRIKEVQGIYYFAPDARPAGKTAFLFPGEGSQYVNMLGDLCLHFPEVRAHFDRIDRVFQQRGRGHLPSDAIFPRPAFTEEDRQAAEASIWQMEGAVESVLTANSALFLLLGKLGIRPDAVMGHSTGEYSAMLAAGMIDLTADDAIAAFSSELNALYHEANAEGEIATAALVAVGGSAADIAGTLANIGSGLHIAMDNCPHQAVIAGPPADVTQAIEALTAQGLICERLPFDRPNHTPLFAAYVRRLGPFLARWISSPPLLPVYSCTTQSPFPGDLAACHEIATEHWVRPVAFRGTVERMAADGFGIFVEAGTSGNLVAFVDDILRGKPHLSVPANLKSRSGTLQLNHLVAMMAAAGAPVDLEYLYAARSPKVLDIADLVPVKVRPLMKLATGWPPMSLSDDVATQLRARSVPPTTPAPAVGSAHSGVQTPAAKAATDGRTPQRAGATLPPATGTYPTSPGVMPSSVETTPPAGGASPSKIGAVAAYFATMDQFLAAQQEVMQAFLAGRGNRVAASPGGEGQRMPNPASVMPVLESTETSSEPEADVVGAAASAGGSMSREEIGAMLLQLVSERTGYPEEMLDLDLDLEASLGIDSIKRVEILGTLQRQTQILRAQDMETLSARKTLRGVIDYLFEAASRPPDDEVPPNPTGGLDRGIGLESMVALMPWLREVTAFVPGESVTALAEISLEAMPFLTDHTLGRELSESDPTLTGLPIVPFTVSMELLAEAAALLMPGLRLAGMRDVRAYRWITLDVPRVTVEVIAQRTGGTGEAYVFLREHAPGGGESAPIIEAIVRFALSLPPAPVAEPVTLAAERSSRWTTEALYREGMFHGPAFRGVKSIDRTGSDGAIATLAVRAPSDLIQGRGNLVSDPVLLDQPGQVVGFWTAETLSEAFVIFPYYLGELELFDVPLPADGEAQCRARVELVGERQVRSDLEILGSDSRVAVRFKAWEDRRFDLPPAFHRLLMGRDIGGLTREWLPPQGAAAGLAGAMAGLDAFPPGFFSAHGAIWQRVLAYNILGANERELWHNLSVPETRRLEWLLGRLAAKGALLNYVRRQGMELRPVEVEIIPDDLGRPIARGAWTSQDSGPLSLSISHSAGVAIALAGSAVGLGIDLEHAANMTSDVLAAGFVEEEMALLARQSEAGWPLRFWCAKEAAIKALGLGNGGSPFSVRVRAFDAGSGEVEVVRRNGDAGGADPEEAILVTTAQQGDYVMAVAVLNVDRSPVKDRV